MTTRLIYRIALAIAVLGFAFAVKTSAWGASALITLDSTSAVLSKSDAGAVTTKIALTNLTTDDVDISFAKPAAAPAGCAPRIIANRAIGPAQHEDVTVAVDACDAKNGVKLNLVATAHPAKGGQPTTPQGLPPVTASFKPQGKAPWRRLWAFLGALLVAVVLVLVLWVAWWVHAKWFRQSSELTEAGTGDGGDDGTDDDSLPSPGLLSPLSGLDTTWSFKDSFASNLTAAAGLLVVVLGSTDVLTAAIGDDAKNSIAVATVAGVIATAAVAFGAGGLLLGAIVALAAAGGQLWTITLLLFDANLSNNADEAIWIGAVVTTLVLAAYSVISLVGTLDIGFYPDPVDPIAPTPEVVAAAVTALSRGGHHQPTRAEVTAFLKSVTDPEASKILWGEPMHPGYDLRGKSALL
jgi:hypothetical protein